MFKCQGYDVNELTKLHNVDEEGLKNKIYLQNTFINVIDVLNFKEFADKANNLKNNESFSIGLSMDSLMKQAYFPKISLDKTLEHLITESKNELPVMNVLKSNERNLKEESARLIFMYNKILKNNQELKNYGIIPMVHQIRLFDNLEKNEMKFALFSLTDKINCSYEQFTKEMTKKYCSERDFDNMTSEQRLRQLIFGEKIENPKDLVIERGRYIKRIYGKQKRVHTNGIYRDGLVLHKKKLSEKTKLPLYPYHTHGGWISEQVQDLYRFVKDIAYKHSIKLE